MSNEVIHIKKWIKLGIVCGLLVSIIYPTLIFVPLPYVVSIALVVLFGPLLSLGSVGLYYFLSLYKKTISARIAVISNIIAGTLITTMLLVQLAIRASKPESIDAPSKWMWESLNHIHLGLDVSWDAYIFIGTFFFAFSMFNHPKFVKAFSISGIIISMLLISLNVITFPTPPADAGLIDMGPFVGMWYFIVTLRIIIGYKGIGDRFNL